MGTDSPLEEAAEPVQSPLEESAELLEPGERANLAASYDPEDLKKVGTKVVERFRQDLRSREDRMRKLDLLQKMYALVVEKKSFPWHNCANIKTPSLTGPNLQIQARLYDMVWPANGKVFNVVPGLGPNDPAAAHVTETYANSYIRERMPYMAQGLDDTLHQMTLYGSSFRRTYWEPYERKVRSDWIPIEDFVVAAKTRSQDPSMSDVPRYTMVHHMSLYDIEARGDEGIFVGADLVLASKADPNDEKSEFAATAEKIDGQAMESDDEDAPRKVLEQHCKWRLPADGAHPAFDGKEHYVVITVDLETSTVLRMSLREEDDPDDVRRAEREKAKYDEAMNAYARDLREYEAQQAGIPPEQPPMPMDQGMGMAPEGGGVMSPPAPEPPAPLAPPVKPVMPMPKPARKRQICFFTHYRCFPSDGFYGLGYGDLLLGITTAQNTIINQWVDGQAVKNARPMFMSRSLRMQRGSIDIGPGSVNEVDAPMGAIKDAIMFLDPPNSDPGTVPLIKMLDGFRDQIAGNGDLMSGQVPGSNQTKGGMQILNEQMMAPITVLARRVKEAFKHELDKIWRCFALWLDDEDIADDIGAPGIVTKSMFTPGMHLVPAADPRMKSQRHEDFQQLFGFCMNNPFIQQNPQVGPAVMAKLTEIGVRLFPDGEQLIPLLHPPPPPPPMPKDQIEENAGFLEGKPSPVLPPDDDDDHLAKLHMFKMSPEFGALDPKGQQAVMQHEREHLAQRMKKGAAFGSGQPPFGGPMGGGPPVMAGPPGIAPPPGPPPG